MRIRWVFILAVLTFALSSAAQTRRKVIIDQDARCSSNHPSAIDPHVHTVPEPRAAGAHGVSFALYTTPSVAPKLFEDVIMADSLADQLGGANHWREWQDESGKSQCGQGASWSRSATT